MNPCPCGYLTDAGRRCRCTSAKIQAYLAKLSGPLLDRIDLHIDVPALPVEALIRPAAAEPSATIKARVLRARRRQRRRLARFGVAYNAQLRHRDLAAACLMTAEEPSCSNAPCGSSTSRPAPTTSSSSSPAPSPIWLMPT